MRWDYMKYTCSCIWYKNELGDDKEPKHEKVRRHSYRSLLLASSMSFNFTENIFVFPHKGIRDDWIRWTFSFNLCVDDDGHQGRSGFVAIVVFILALTFRARGAEEYTSTPLYPPVLHGLARVETIHLDEPRIRTAEKLVVQLVLLMASELVSQQCVTFPLGRSMGNGDDLSFAPYVSLDRGTTWLPKFLVGIEKHRCVKFRSGKRKKQRERHGVFDARASVVGSGWLGMVDSLGTETTGGAQLTMIGCAASPTRTTFPLSCTQLSNGS